MEQTEKAENECLKSAIQRNVDKYSLHACNYVTQSLFQKIQFSFILQAPLDRPLDDKLEHPAKILLARVRRIRVKARNLKATFFTESNRPVSAEAIAGANNDCAVISGELERTLGMSTVS